MIVVGLVLTRMQRCVQLSRPQHLSVLRQIFDCRGEVPMHRVAEQLFLVLHHLVSVLVESVLKSDLGVEWILDHLKHHVVDCHWLIVDGGSLIFQISGGRLLILRLFLCSLPSGFLFHELFKSFFFGGQQEFINVFVEPNVRNTVGGQ